MKYALFAAVIAAPALAQTVTTVEVDPPELAPVETEAPFLRGAYAYGPEVSTFQQCGGERVVWLDGPEVEMKLLADNAMAVSARNEPYSPIFAVITAQDAQPEGEFAKDYDGTMDLLTLEDLSWTIPADCDLPGIGD